MDTSGAGQMHSCNLHRNETYKFAQKQWKVLYNVVEAVQLQDAIKCHLFSLTFPENDILQNMEDINDAFDPLEV